MLMLQTYVVWSDVLLQVVLHSDLSLVGWRTRPTCFACEVFAKHSPHPHSLTFFCVIFTFRIITLNTNVGRK